MSLRHAVLGLLSNGPASGYDLLKVFEISLANVWPATQSQLYAELGRMADVGLVEVAAEGPRGRKEYAITDEGMAELRHWMAEVPPDRPRRNDMLLRVFFLGLLEPQQAIDFLRRQAEFAAERHKGLVALQDEVQGDDPLSIYGRFALEWGLRFTTASQEWAKWAEDELKAVHKPEV
jgi:PadR family transcriptional regulator AphA